MRLRLPRPKTFIGLMSLQTGTELIALSLLFNKATGVYGILAIFTGYALSAVQLSMYILALLTLIALAYALPHIRKQSPFENLALAWLYVLDTIAGAAYTTVYAVAWYNASFHDPKGPAGADDDTSAANSTITADGNPGAPVIKAAGVQETATSLVLVVLFTLVRVYFCLVVMAYARMVLQRFAGEQQYNNAATTEEEDGDDNTITEVDESKSVFAVGQQLGDGWKGKLGRIMVSVGRGYWMERKEDEEWTRHVSSKFRARTLRV
ncbi:Inositolphosphorylceramide synthase subunit Kei1-domain-containing protein [Apodospora peruviana]|uniref:Inositolphosphorylceramide synthase subunit Kei1-domain-containing protein n=1 Tax=Apodospora peruviana TaxID=516989 RepID=A0AAE0I625_9PEZI|nr:Inositolphosphorylceramide synthase subunit Kei1-domain-containing protein [Apodospora peruviana]